MNRSSPVILGSVGLGGYAGTICDLLEQGSSLNQPVRLAAVFEPDHVAHAARIAELRARGIKVYKSFDQLLSEPVEAVWLPIPIHLHRPFTEQALAAGKAVMSEKPAAGCVKDVDAMIAARDRAKLPVSVGFQDIYQHETALLKRKLLDGGLGTIRSATLRADWPRNHHYFQRSNWAGKLKIGDTWILDSPPQNALGHFINLLLFMLGPSEYESAEPVSVEAELYRANPIENYDTCALRFTTATGVSALALLTHGCTTPFQPEITIYGDEGTMHYKTWKNATISTHGNAVTIPLPHTTNLSAMLQRFAKLVRGEPDPLPVATLEVARQHTLVINGASEASAINDVPYSLLKRNGSRLHVIAGIERLFEHCAREQILPHESGLAPWTVPASRCDLTNYDRFAGPHNVARATLRSVN